MKYEYAVFTIQIPWNRKTLSSIKDWPDTEAVEAQLVKMNELGADGWEIFMRAKPNDGLPEDLNLPTMPYNFWARRRIE